jgi:uncharacterized protein YqjF (DUF2071 family)
MKNFLAAVWTNLLVATYEVDKSMLIDFLPRKTELNDWNGKYLLSIVGFIFSEPSIMGMRMPFFHQFPEINLRFYVKCKIKKEWCTGVVFIREISPSFLIGITAKLLYREKFITAPMQHHHDCSESQRFTRYSWKDKNGWSYLELDSTLTPMIMCNGNVESFICNQYNAFTKINSHKTLHFAVSHKPWQVYSAASFNNDINADIFNVKGLSQVLDQKPVATFLMDGSFTEVSKPRLL